MSTCYSGMQARSECLGLIKVSSVELGKLPVDTCQNLRPNMINERKASERERRLLQQSSGCLASCSQLLLKLLVGFSQHPPSASADDYYDRINEDNIVYCMDKPKLYNFILVLSL